MQFRGQYSRSEVQEQRVSQQPRSLHGDEFSVGTTLLAPRSPESSGINDHSPVRLNSDLDPFLRCQGSQVLCLVCNLGVDAGDFAVNRLDVRQNVSIARRKSLGASQEILRNLSIRVCPGKSGGSASLASCRIAPAKGGCHPWRT